MSRFMRNSLRLAAVLIFLAGVPVAFLMVSGYSPERHVIAGIASGFALLGLFIWFLTVKSPKAKTIASIIILIGGLVSGFLIGYRVGWSPAPPWSWDRGVYSQVVIGPYLDWNAAMMSWGIFIILGVTLLLARKNSKSKTKLGLSIKMIAGLLVFIILLFFPQYTTKVGWLVGDNYTGFQLLFKIGPYIAVVPFCLVIIQLALVIINIFMKKRSVEYIITLLNAISVCLLIYVYIVMPKNPPSNAFIIMYGGRFFPLFWISLASLIISLIISITTLFQNDIINSVNINSPNYRE